MNNKLLQQLNEQELNLNELLEAVKEQQRALIENNLSAMHLSARKEEALLNEMNRCQSRTIEVIKEFAIEKGLKLNNPRLTELLKLVNTDDFAEYDQCANAVANIKSRTNKISRVNFQNKLLISQSRAFIKDTISELTEQGEKKILDKRM